MSTNLSKYAQTVLIMSSLRHKNSNVGEPPHTQTCLREEGPRCRARSSKVVESPTSPKSRDENRRCRGEGRVYG